ncbi:MAG: hypothetical protein A3K77_07340 [Euryarchaeota archaeon RBG_13_31_8]|nr:MAG: hypothetical protein A3K77_07340 [Euryarchaeota archaeon RBG_13_31_8]
MYIIVKNNRHRYIYFIVEPSDKQFIVEKPQIINEIRQQCKNLFNKNFESMGLRLISFDGKKGIVKCNHVEKENTIKLLNSIKKISLNEIVVKTISTSGTIKTLIEKYKIKKS